MKLPSLPEQPKNSHRPDDVLPSPIPTPQQTYDVQDLQNQISFTDASLLPRVMRIVKITIVPNSATNEYRHQADAASAAANVYAAAHRLGCSFGVAPQSGQGKGANFRYE
jgi:hypothetical protein